MDPEPSTHWPDLETETRSTVDPRPASELRIPGLTVLAHPDVRRVGECALLPALGAGQEVPVSRLEPLFAVPGGPRRRPLGDPHLSRRPLRLEIATKGGLHLLTEPSKARLTIDGAPIDGDRQVTAEELVRGLVLVLAERVALLLHLLDPTPPPELPRFGLVGDSLAVHDLRLQISRVADADAPVLLRGATGTGKELVASAIHQTSPRSDGPFVAVNMAAVPADLAAAELFGAARGAFTGAERQRSGYFSRADGGTLFLDEIGDTPVDVQVQLLRVLETGVIQPLGAEKAQAVDVRIVAATDSQLESEIAAGRFRAPLLHRVAGYEIRLPTLIERRDDFGRLLFYFLRRELESLDEAWRLDDPARPWLPAPAVASLALYSWPGNVRQLRNIARQLAIGNRGAPQAWLTPEIERLLTAEVEASEAPFATSVGIVSGPPAFPEESGEPSESRATPPAASETLRDAPTEPAPRPERRPVYRSRDQVTEDELLAALRAHGFRLQPTAAALGISRTALYALVDSSPRIRKARDLGSEEIERCRVRCNDDLEAMAAELEVSRKGLRIRMTQLGLP